MGITYKAMKTFFTSISLLIITISFLCCRNKNNSFDDIIIPDTGIENDTDNVPFKHPGLLVNDNDINYLKQKLEISPWKEGYSDLKKIDEKLGTINGPFKEIIRGDGVDSSTALALSGDAKKAYHMALMWYITKEKKYADWAIYIINEWTKTLKEVSGEGALLACAWYGFALINAAEILRYTDSGWKEEDIKLAENFFIDVLYSRTQNWKNGLSGNWDTAITKFNMAVGIFCNDKNIFEKAIDMFKSKDANNGTLLRYIYDTGQCHESARDQEHAQMGICGLVEACEVAWKQGVDLYSYANNRLLLGVEYTAKYNLGYDDLPPFIQNKHGKVISELERGKFLPYYELVLNHYLNRINRPLDEIKYTQEVVTKVRKKFGCEQSSTICTGLGTLLFNQTK